MDCGVARKSALRYLRSGQPRPGFECVPAQGRTPFFCKDGEKVYWAVRL